MAPKKRRADDSRADSTTNIAALAAAARRSRLAHRRRHPKAPPLTADDKLADAILEAMEVGGAMPSATKIRGPEFEDVEDEVCFGDAVGVEFIDRMRTDRLQSSAGGKAVLKAIAACKECDEDQAHWDGEEGELLDAIANDECTPRITPMRARNPFNPVALLCPPTEVPLCAVAAENIQVGEPIAQYLGDLCLEDGTGGGASNTYIYELAADEMRRRGFKGSATLRVDASKAGGEARFINDKWSPGGLPARRANCFVELIFDGDAKEFMLVFFASRKIRKGEEVIADYGPDYWKVASAALLEAHAEAEGAPHANDASQKSGAAKKKARAR